ncbi:MAG: (Fe-S)-binding protein [Acidobacteria bacterium]|nr:(Fe-S)-binding protein [Acidobacteriota bacterium]
MKVSLFVTCLVDQFAPRVGVAMVDVLTRLGVAVTFNPEQTCCGQPAFNNGHRREARPVAARLLEVFEQELASSDYLVAPSGSCTAMVRQHYAELFSDEPELRARAERVGARLFEFSQFLVDVLGVESVGAASRGRIAYHDSCHLLRELGVSSQPRRLIDNTLGTQRVEMERADSCCGFGGTFSVKYPEIAAALAEDKVVAVERSGADVLVACDSGCLMQIEGLMRRRGSGVRCLHLAELLALREV